MVSERTSRPLASLVREGRLWGSFVLAAGIVFVLAGVFVDGTLAAVIFLAIGAPIFGWIQVREQRTRLARALETSASPPAQTRESTKATRMRMVFAALYLVLVGVVIGVAEELWWFGFSALPYSWEECTLAWERGSYWRLARSLAGRSQITPSCCTSRSGVGAAREGVATSGDLTRQGAIRSSSSSWAARRESEPLTVLRVWREAGDGYQAWPIALWVDPLRFY